MMYYNYRKIKRGNTGGKKNVSYLISDGFGTLERGIVGGTDDSYQHVSYYMVRQEDNKMTNAMIIMFQQEALAEAGILEYTGREIEVALPDESVMTFKEVEPIHTYSRWRELGFQVQKGETAIAKFKVWKHTSKKNKETDEDESRMFMKTASFFKQSQVKEIEK